MGRPKFLDSNPIVGGRQEKTAFVGGPVQQQCSPGLAHDPTARNILEPGWIAFLVEQ